MVTKDIAIDTGATLGVYTDYWTDSDFTIPVAAQLDRPLEFLTKL